MENRNRSSDFIALEKKFTKPPVIIGGCGRSGTTLLLSILSAHPSIFGIPYETNAFTKDAIDLQPINDYFLTQDVPYGSRWCEKTPRNILFVDDIINYFDQRVRILNIVRDGRDVVLSRHPERPTSFWVDAERWINDVNAGVLAEQKPQVMTLKYEELVLNFDVTIRKIFRFIDEVYDEKLLNWHQHTTIKSHEALFEQAEPVHDRSIGKWRSIRYRGRVKGLINKPQAQELLRHYNYID